MGILEIIKNRRSIRAFKRKEIPKEILDELIEAIILAPSAGNLQSRKFYFIFDEKLKNELAVVALDQNFIAKAPLVVVGCTDDKITFRYGERGKNLYSICDVSASIQNMMLLATEKGLGTCWVGAFDEREVSKILNLPENLRPIAIIPIGFPAEKPSASPKISKEKAVEIL
ncbi:nitroreductase [Parcubacteria bacterium DG_74_2]|nr:MAG: nitroreductase [Parcubacteria bacterium DG_74_2]